MHSILTLARRGEASVRWRVLAGGVLLLLAVLLTAQVTFTELMPARPNRPYWDASQYFDIAARAIEQGGFGGFYNSVRTYGYPLFVTLPKLFITDDHHRPWMEALRALQFTLHVLTAFMAAGIAARLGAGKRIRWLAFLLVLVNPMLLGLTLQILTETLSTFLLALLVLLALYRRSVLNSVALGAVLGALIVTRPFYMTWALAVAGGLLALHMILRLITRQGIPRPHAPEIRRAVLLGMALAFPLLLVVIPQLALIYIGEGTIGLTGEWGNEWISTHINTSTYVYKYETFVGVEGTPQMYYTNTQREALAADKTLTETILADLPGYAAHIALKSIGMFQAYETSPYRVTTEDSPLDPVFLMSFVSFAGLVYVLAATGWAAIKSPRTLLTAPAALLLAVLAHWFAYSIPTIPEPRFITPILPLIAALAVATYSLRRDRWLLVGSVGAALVLYAITYAVITPTQQVLPPAPLF